MKKSLLAIVFVFTITIAYSQQFKYVAGSAKTYNLISKQFDDSSAVYAEVYLDLTNKYVTVSYQGRFAKYIISSYGTEPAPGGDATRPSLVCSIQSGVYYQFIFLYDAAGILMLPVDGNQHAVMIFENLRIVHYR